MTPDPELTRLGAAEAARLLRARELSSVELVDALLARIEAVNPHVNAIRVVLAEQARDAALAADRRLATAAPAGPLDGIPFTVKENVDVAGTATTQGVAALADALATADAPVVANLRRAGAIPLARTNMPDFALRWHTDSGIAGATVNPWDPALSPGGSSGGEAVALATGMSPLGVGNDLGGSLRWPSQCAGTAALRPTLGRIPHARSLEPTAPPLNLQLIDVQGPMARRVEDLRLALVAMAQPDPRDPWHVPAPASWTPPGDGPPRVHVMHELPGLRLDDAVERGLLRAADALHDAGYALSDARPPLEEAAALWLPLMSTDARRVWPELAPLASADAGGFMDAVLSLIPPLGLDEYGELFESRQRLGRTWSEYQHATPLVLAPICTRLPQAAGSDLGGADAAREIVESLRATLAVNALGLPSVAVPVGLEDGLPQAVQIIGPRFGEALCLDAAEAIERAVGSATPIDPLSARSVGAAAR
jgi:amidase